MTELPLSRTEAAASAKRNVGEINAPATWAEELLPVEEDVRRPNAASHHPCCSQKSASTRLHGPFI